MFKYIRHSQYRAGKASTLINIASDYYDYLTALKKLQTPFTKDVLFPTVLATAHDSTIEKLKNYQEKTKNTEFKKMAASYKVLDFENDTYKIFTIDTIEQLNREAQKLHNCAASYVDRIIGGSSMLFLIRKKEHPRKPFYMLELNPKDFSIVQNRGLRNCNATDEVKAFEELWLKSKVLPSVPKITAKKN